MSRIPASSPLITFLNKIVVSCPRCRDRWHVWTSFGDQYVGCSCRIVRTETIWAGMQIGEL